MEKYTVEAVTAMTSAYVAAVAADADYEARSAVVKQLADEQGVSVPAVRGVLVNAGVYVAKEAGANAAKSATGKFSKEELVKAFEAVTGEPSLKGLTGATQKDLQKLWDWVVSTSDAKSVA